MGKTRPTTAIIGFIAIVATIILFRAGYKGDFVTAAYAFAITAIAGFIWGYRMQSYILKQAKERKNIYRI